MAWTTPGTAVAGDVLTAAFWNAQVRDNLNVFSALNADWTSYTPTLAQGASTNISKTINSAKYMKVGSLIFVVIYLVSTGTGSANSPITVSLPSGITFNQSFFLMGSAQYNDVSVTRYPSFPYVLTSSTFGMRRCDQSPSGSVGEDPNIAVASGDEFFASFTGQVNI